MEEEDNKKLEYFLKWASNLGISDSLLKSNSCLGHSLTLCHFPEAGGRGLAAARDLKRGELVLKVPKSALLTKDSFFKDGFLLSTVNNHSALSATQMLIVCLLYEIGKGKSSFWYPYLMHLPRSFELLATFSEFEKQALQVGDAIWTAQNAISKAEFEWKGAYSLMQELKVKPQFLTLRAWIWATATISSRTMHISWDEAGCLCPVGDFFNYAAPGEEFEHNLNTETSDAHSQRFRDAGFDEDAGAYCFYARQNYNRGEQVLLSYGTYTNLELLEHYGFILNDNPNDKAFIPLETRIHASNSWPKESMYIHQDGIPSFALLCALRLWATPPNQRKSVGHLAYSGSQLSAENEILVLNWISKSCHDVLKNLPTTFEEDHLLKSTIDKIQNQKSQSLLELLVMQCQGQGELCDFLKAHNDGDKVLVLSSKVTRSMERWKLAVQWRFRYKNILIDCISYCTQIISSLSNENVATSTPT